MEHNGGYHRSKNKTPILPTQNLQLSMIFESQYRPASAMPKYSLFPSYCLIAPAASIKLPKDARTDHAKLHLALSCRSSLIHLLDSLPRHHTHRATIPPLNKVGHC